MIVAKLKTAASILMTRGPQAVVTKSLDILFPARDVALKNGRALFLGKIGLEIGGPSGVFGSRGLLPVYDWADRIDNCNFAAETIWEGRIEAGETFQFSPAKQPGRQYVAEATDLSTIADGQYDFLLSSHAIEHSANPLLALKEWRRVARAGATFALIIPHKDGTFDHRRPTTPLSHLLEDYGRDTPETDLTHLDEILALHDLDRDSGAVSREAFEMRARRNFENRGLHHHVFDTRSAVEMVAWAGLQIRFIQAIRPNHILIIAANITPDESIVASPALAVKSPFPSDRDMSVGT